MSDVNVTRDVAWWIDAGLVWTAYGLALAGGLACGRLIVVTSPGFGGEHSSLLVAFGADLAGTAIIYLFSLAFRNSSFYDAYWSALPPVVAMYWFYAQESGGDGFACGFAWQVSFRRVVVVLVCFAWAARLTFNWQRGWAGLQHEDWRYTQLRKQSIAGGLGVTGYWLLTSLCGIHLFPTIIVFGTLLPVWGALRGTDCFGVLDILGILISVFSVLLQLVADEQLREFRRRRHTTGRYGTGINDSGVWMWCRHPNYTGELGHWLGYVFLAMGADRARNWWTAMGWVPLLLLFALASVPLMEHRMLSKRPRYAEYQKEVWSLIPRPPPSGKRID